MPAYPTFPRSGNAADATGPGGFAAVPRGIARPSPDEDHEHAALYDPLTALPNRQLLRERLQSALAYAAMNKWTTGLMSVALDRFGHVNATYGDAEGDRLLRVVAERLARAVRRGDTVGRLDGDQFAVVLTNLAEGIDAEIVAKKIAVSLATPFAVSADSLSITASIGISLSPYDAIDDEALMHSAEAAMREAKRRGRNRYRFFAIPGQPLS